jgi:hypothetical protein
VQPPAHEPHEQSRVEVFGPKVGGREVVPPLAERDDHRPERHAGVGEVVLGSGPALEQPGALKGRQPLGQQGPGDPRQPSMQVVEAMAAGEQLAEDERCPSLGEDLRAERDRAELSVGGVHAVIVDPADDPDKYCF